MFNLFKDKEIPKKEEPIKGEYPKEEIVWCELCGEWRNWIEINEEESLEEVKKSYDCVGCGANLATQKIENEYTIVLGEDLRELKKRVNLVIKQGYKPVGKFTVSSSSHFSKYYQPMLKIKEV